MINREKPILSLLLNIFFVAYTMSFAVEKLITVKTKVGLIFLPEILFIPLAVCFLCQLPKIWQNRYSILSKWHVLDSIILAYGFTVFLSYIFHPSLNSLREVYGCGYMLIFYFIVNLSFPQKALSTLLINSLKLFVLSGIIASIISIGSYILSSIGFNSDLAHKNADYPLIGDTLRAYGLFRNPIFHANFLACTFIVFISYYFEEIRKLSLRFVLLMLLFLTALILTKTKSILIVFAIGLYFVSTVWQAQKTVRYALFIVSVLLSVAYLFLSHFLIVNMQHTHLTEDYYFPQYIWHVTDHYAIVPTFYYGTKHAALLAFYDFFPFGVGGDNLATYVNQLVAQKRHLQAFCCAPHSTFFGALGELGLLGFALILALFFKIWQMAISIKLNNSVIPNFNLMTKSIAFLFTFEAVTVDLMNVRHFWLILALLALIFRESKKNEK